MGCLFRIFVFHAKAEVTYPMRVIKPAAMLRVCDTEQESADILYWNRGYTNPSAKEGTRKVALHFTLPILTLADGFLETILKRFTVPKPAVAGLHLQQRTSWFLWRSHLC